MKTYYSVHYNDHINGRFEAWLGEPKQAECKPNNKWIVGNKIDKCTEWFETKKEAIEFITSQCKNLVKKPEFELYGRNW